LPERRRKNGDIGACTVCGAS